MDKLRPFIAWLKKYHFWVFSGVVAVLAIAGWFLATANLDQQYETRAGEIKTRLSSAQQIANTQNHPNSQFEESMQEWLTTYRQDIDLAWQKKWEAQQKELSWPSELNVRGTNFADAVNGILLGRPIEALSEEDKELPTRLRELYRDYIKEELPKLAEIIGAKWAPQGGAGGSGMGAEYGISGGYEAATDYGMAGGMEGMGGAIPLEKPPLVVWNPANQGAIQAKSFDWSQQLNNTPTTKEVLYAQENLWVLENLMKIIAKTNGSINSPHQATIKMIESIEFGKDVMPIRSKVVVPRIATSTAGADGMGMEGMGMDMEMGMGMEGDPSMMGEYGEGSYDEMGMGAMGPDGMPLDGAAPNPGDRRYVDKDYRKLSLTDLQAATTDPTSENYYLAVAKRLPIRLKLVMDQREIDKLLVECGNADLMVEVRQVRVNAKDTGGTGGDMYGGGGMEMGGGYGGMQDFGIGGAGGSDYGSGMGGTGGTGSEPAEKIFDVPVEIYGIIYIYNPVNQELLGTDDEDSSDDPATPDPTATASVR